jgi:hypothetical protein
MLGSKLRYVFVFTLTISSAVLIDSCVSHDLEGPVVVDCTGFKTVSFSSDIQPIISANCAISGCHNGDNGTDLNWTDPAKFKDHAAEAKRRVALPRTDGDHMPQVGSITSDQIKLIVCWAEQGASIDN